MPEMPVGWLNTETGKFHRTNPAALTHSGFAAQKMSQAGERHLDMHPVIWMIANGWVRFLWWYSTAEGKSIGIEASDRADFGAVQDWVMTVHAEHKIANFMTVDLWIGGVQYGGEMSLEDFYDKKSWRGVARGLERVE